MHLLTGETGLFSEGGGAVDLGQSPAALVVLSAADSELACLAAAYDRLGAAAPTNYRGAAAPAIHPGAAAPAIHPGAAAPTLYPDAGAPTLRLANWQRLGHPLSVDLYLEQVIRKSRLVVVRLLGGRAYWPYGVEQLVLLARAGGPALAFLPGDDRPDSELAELSTLPTEAALRLWRYLVHGGVDNAQQFLIYAATLAGVPGVGPIPAEREPVWREPAPLPRASLYWPGLGQPTLDDLRRCWAPETQEPRGALDAPMRCQAPDAPVVGVVFYRALLQAGDLAAIDALIAALTARGLAPLPVAVTSLRESQPARVVEALFAATPPAVILNATAFAVDRPGDQRGGTPFDGADCPVLQVILAGTPESAWRESTSGLSARDVAMNVALPEVDGRIITRAIAFKAEARLHRPTESRLVAVQPVADRVAFAADLAAAWVRLRATPAAERRIAIVLANYPNRDARLGNGVGLDTPESVVDTLAWLEEAGYRVDGRPPTGAALMQALTAGVTNDDAALAPAGTDADGGRRVSETLALAAYRDWFTRLPPAVTQAITGRWGAPEDDPFVADGAFRLPVLRFGHVAVAIQPARGYNIDPARSYHDPALPPPHNYLAFYAWLRGCGDDGTPPAGFSAHAAGFFAHAAGFFAHAAGFFAHAIIQFGKHGNLEWLPGKAVALSAQCLPEAILGPLPLLYPFIVNDPGEGTQAKRRAAAVIVDHLTPPLTRAGSYGPLRALELLVDEYAEAARMDPRRLPTLRRSILELAATTGLDRDSGITGDHTTDEALLRLDQWLCEVKELQIRDGLHIFGRSPVGNLRRSLLLALVRLPRGRGEGGDASLMRALAADVGLGFDPLCPEQGARSGDAVPRHPLPKAAGLWEPFMGSGGRCPQWGPGAKPLVAEGPKDLDRLETLAESLIDETQAPSPDWHRTKAVLARVRDTLAPALDACGTAERTALLRGLDGRFVLPGPSGAPTRGRPEVLPTGRNFHGLDPRAVPTPAAWALGAASAARIIERHLQEHGDWPRRIALSAWGTANMRTGGDDIAQALALMGVRPTWEGSTGRLTGFDIIPLAELDRPRVDVTLRISGFFRDAFPFQIDLIDRAVRAVAALDEPADSNPLAARVRADREGLIAAGVTTAEAEARAAFRVFGSRPGAYGAGLQALIDEGTWQTRADLADAYLTWGGYAYGEHAAGRPERALLEQRLATVEVVLHNQDNREHDLLDSDDYYQFEGGLTAAVATLSGQEPTVFHADHSLPERPRIRTLAEEVARIVRGRVVNPKWIAGVMRHGYKGAFEMAATVDYLFAFAATTRAVADHHFDAVFAAYLEDPEVCGFLRCANPAALADIARRLAEAQERGLWQPRSNHSHQRLRELCETGRRRGSHTGERKG